MKKQRKQFKIIIIATVTTLTTLIIFDSTPFGGTIKFYSTWGKCGQVPVSIRGSGFLNEAASHYYTPPKLNIYPGNKTYFCTAFDAEKRGYSANPEEYDFPVLRANNALCMRSGDPEPETAAIFSPCTN